MSQVVIVDYDRMKFQNTNPERGRKQQAYTHGIIGGKISEHEPRKGTETRDCRLNRRRLVHFRTRTPKGDGNAVKAMGITPLRLFHFRTRTPKGDGNARDTVRYTAHG